MSSRSFPTAAALLSSRRPIAAPQSVRAADAHRRSRRKPTSWSSWRSPPARNTRDPFNDVTLDVDFIDPTGRDFACPRSGRGRNVEGALRLAASSARTRFRSECSGRERHGTARRHRQGGGRAYNGENPLYIHGPLRVAADKRYLEHADGTPFFWLGDTWWMGLCHRLHWPDEFKTLAADRKEKGFNVIQIVAGLYPDMPPFDPRGANEAGLPVGEGLRTHPPGIFERPTSGCEYLVDQGFTPCIVGAWGYFMPWMGVGEDEAALAVSRSRATARCRWSGAPPARRICRGIWPKDFPTTIASR